MAAQNKKGAPRFREAPSIFKALGLSNSALIDRSH